MYLQLTSYKPYQGPLVPHFCCNRFANSHLLIIANAQRPRVLATLNTNAGVHENSAYACFIRNVET